MPQPCAEIIEACWWCLQAQLTCRSRPAAITIMSGVEALEVVLPVTAAVTQLHSACHPVLQLAMAGSCQRPSHDANQAFKGP